MRLFRVSTWSLIIVLLITGGLACNNSNNSNKATQAKPKATGTVKVGDTAPDFEMRNQDQLNVSLSEFKGKKNVLLVFYPADFTPV